MPTTPELAGAGLGKAARLLGQDIQTGIAAAGTAQSDATALTHPISLVATVAASAGVRLPAAGGRPVHVAVNQGANALTVYPATGESINGGSVNAGVSISANRAGLFIPAATQWAYVQASIEDTLAALTVTDLTATTLTLSGALTRASRQLFVPAWFGKAGATAGWVVTGADDGLARLPASQTGSTLVIPVPGLAVGDIVTGCGVVGQVESAGNNVTCTLSFRKQTAAAADITDAELATDDVGTLTADTILSAANLGVTGLTETIAADEALYALITATTAASTDIAIMGLILSLTQK